jgi:hypothetical protein
LNEGDKEVSKRTTSSDILRKPLLAGSRKTKIRPGFFEEDEG